MGNQTSTTKFIAEDSVASRRSAEIDRIIEEDSKTYRKSVNVLVLGSPESGSSTIIKQMKIIHQRGFSPQEHTGHRTAIYQNLWGSARTIVFAMYKLSIEPVDPRNQEAAKQIAHHEMDLSSIDSDFRFPEQLALSINRLWHDPVIPQIMEYHGNGFYLMDSASYFLAEAKRIGGANYVPSEMDILRCWQRDTKMIETEFDIGLLSIRMIDPGGQRSQRKKWIHCFEGVTSILFCTSLAEYDQTIPGEENKNRMSESIALFDAVVNSRWFLWTSIILFMNKVDVFRNKIPKVPLERYCPEYIGGSDVSKAAKFILFKYMETNRAKLSVYPHLTQATDTTNVRLVFAAVKETIIQNTLRLSGIKTL